MATTFACLTFIIYSEFLGLRIKVANHGSSQNPRFVVALHLFAIVLVYQTHVSFLLKIRYVRLRNHFCLGNSRQARYSANISQHASMNSVSGTSIESKSVHMIVMNTRFAVIYA